MYETKIKANVNFTSKTRVFGIDSTLSRLGTNKTPATPKIAEITIFAAIKLLK